MRPAINGSWIVELQDAHTMHLRLESFDACLLIIKKPSSHNRARMTLLPRYSPATVNKVHPYSIALQSTMDFKHK